MEFNLKLVILVLCMSALLGCNAYIGIPADPETQPWRSIYLFSFITILITPLVSLVALIFSFWQKPLFKLKLEKYLNYSVIVMGGLWLISEMALTSRTNIRLDLFIIIPVFIIQLVLVAIGGFVANSAEKNL
jgi:hypothetical protein